MNSYSRFILCHNVTAQTLADKGWETKGTTLYAPPPPTFTAAHDKLLSIVLSVCRDQGRRRNNRTDDPSPPPLPPPRAPGHPSRLPCARPMLAQHHRPWRSIETAQGQRILGWDPLWHHAEFMWSLISVVLHWPSNSFILWHLGDVCVCNVKMRARQCSHILCRSFPIAVRGLDSESILVMRVFVSAWEKSPVHELRGTTNTLT